MCCHITMTNTIESHKKRFKINFAIEANFFLVLTWLRHITFTPGSLHFILEKNYTNQSAVSVFFFSNPVAPDSNNSLYVTGNHLKSPVGSLLRHTHCKFLRKYCLIPLTHRLSNWGRLPHQQTENIFNK